MTTAATYPRQNSSNTISIITLLLIAVTIIGVTIIMTMQVQNGRHAIEKHGAEAELIHVELDCNNGERELWKSMSYRTPNKHYQLCELPDGRWGMRIVDWMRGQWREKTSFIVKDGTYQETIEYVSARAEWVR